MEDKKKYKRKRNYKELKEEIIIKNNSEKKNLL